MQDIYTKIENIYKDTINETKNINELITIMNTKEVRDIINTFLNSDIISDNDAINLNILINATQLIYENTGESTGMSDSEYDLLYEKLSLKEDNINITPELIDKNNVVHHKYKSLRGTLDKIYALTDDELLDNKSRKTLNDWIKSCENKIYEKTKMKINLDNEEVYCFPKFDGVSGIFHFSKDGKLQQVLTRGDTTTNEAKDITHIFESWVKGPFDNSEYDYGIKTEIMMSDENFNEYNKIYKTDYKQSRSIVSSIINSDEVDERINYLQLMQLRMSHLDENNNESLQELAPGAFNVPYLKCRLKDRDKMKEFAFNHKYANGLRCDGMVIYLIDNKLQNILGRENNKQKFEVAYKFTEESGYSKIKDIKFTTGLFGRINPVAVIKPIKLKGNTIENISLGSIGRFLDLKLAKGDKVKILYDIIPYLVFDDKDDNCKRSGNDIIEAPEVCLSCGQLLEKSESGDLLYCVNPKCPCKIKGKILNYVQKMNIDLLSYNTIDTLYDFGYLKSIKDIYKLEKNKKYISEIPGLGIKTITKIIDEINNNKTVYNSILLGSLGIENMSRRMFKKVMSMITFDELIDLCMDEEHPSQAINVLSVIPGIKEKSAIKIINGIRENIKLIEFLEKELILVEDEKESSYKYSVVFTKVRDKDIEEWIKDNDGIVKDNLSKDVNILVVPMNGVESSKVTKAKKYGIDVVAINELKDFINEKFLK